MPRVATQVRFMGKLGPAIQHWTTSSCARPYWLTPSSPTPAALGGTPLLVLLAVKCCLRL